MYCWQKNNSSISNEADEKKSGIFVDLMGLENIIVHISAAQKLLFIISSNKKMENLSFFDVEQNFSVLEFFACQQDMAGVLKLKA